MFRRPAPMVLAASAVLVCASGARAQVDVNPPLPNVLILLDTSGSMENMLDGNTPESEGATCAFSYTGNNIGNVTVNPVAAALGTTPNRWGVEMQALTGYMPLYNCVSMPRTAGSYLTTEYSIDGHMPYDNGYALPFHRPVVGVDLGNDATSACMVAPGVLPGDPSGGVGNPMKGVAGLASDFPANAITTRLLNGNAGACAFTQYQNGILDTASSMIRFGLMTYDNDPAAGVGATIPALQVANTPTSPFDGQWSYFPGWNGAGTPATGHPADCATPSVFQVGAKNPAAPPWEGRLVGFPVPAATSAQTLTQNQQLQSVITALRPYGATPTAGMFAGAQYYFWTDPAGPGLGNDPYVQGNCRSQYILHITDGVPNEDLRPSCSQSPVNPRLAGLVPVPAPGDDRCGALRRRWRQSLDTRPTSSAWPSAPSAACSAHTITTHRPAVPTH